MLIQFHATLAASCNLRDIKDINGIAFFAYFDGTFSQRGIQFLFPTFVLQFMLWVSKFITLILPCTLGLQKHLTQLLFYLTKQTEFKIISIRNDRGCVPLCLQNIRHFKKLNYNRICFSVVCLRGITLASVTVEGCPETETYYPGRDYTPRASQLNIIHLKASAFAVSLRCHP